MGREAMQSVRDILEHKGYVTITTTPDSEIWSALQLMARRDVGSLIVMQGDSLKGILTERDYVWRVARERVDITHAKVGEVMNPQVYRVTPADSLDTAMRAMTDHRVRHVVVMEGGLVRGLVSIGDVVRALLEDQTETIDELRRYIEEKPSNMAF
jgi:CBS domain-containing protein